MSDVDSAKADMNRAQMAIASAAAINDGLIAYYSFDGNGSDLSGNGNTAQAYGSVTYVTGVSGQAAKLGGVSDVDYFRVASSSSLALGQTMTLSYWVRVDGYTGMDGYGVARADRYFGTILARSGDRNGFVDRVEGWPSGTGNHHFADWRGGATGTDTVIGNDLRDDQFHHVTVAIADRSMVFYLDGQETYRTTTDVNPAYSNGKDLYIGAEADLGGIWYPLNGALDDLRLYNRTLSSAEVAQLYNSARMPDVTVSSLAVEMARMSVAAYENSADPTLTSSQAPDNALPVGRSGAWASVEGLVTGNATGVYSFDYDYSGTTLHEVAHVYQGNLRIGSEAAKQKTLIVAFRGTDEDSELSADSWDITALCKAMKPLILGIKAYIAGNPEIQRVVLTGHSLGGAMAEYWAYHSAEWVAGSVTSQDVQGITFGSPGCDLDDIEPAASGSSVTRVVHTSDPVPSFGTARLYDQVGAKLAIDRKDLSIFSTNLSKISFSNVTEWEIGAHSVLEYVRSTAAAYLEGVDLAVSEPKMFIPNHVSTVDERFIHSDIGTDVISTLPADGIVFGRAIADKLSVASNDTISVNMRAGAGNDQLVLGAGADFIKGDAGDDQIDGGYGNDTLIGGDGQDVIYGGFSDSSGNPDNDSIEGGDGADSINGFGGDDWIFGGLGDDTMYGGIGDDTVLGGRGADRVYGGKGDDSISSGQDSDTIESGLGNDTVLAGQQDDLVLAGQGDDFILGGLGNDTLNGALGNDTLEGNGGDDLLIGGDGADLFRLIVPSGADTVQGFSAAAGDRFQLAAGATYTIVQTAAGARVSVVGGTLLVSGVSVGSLTSDLFITA